MNDSQYSQIAVFLDRDGTLIHEAHYLKEVKDLKLYSNTAQSIKKLNQKNIPAIMLSNQSGVARGYFSEDDVRFINSSMNDMLEQEGAHLDGFYYCPHHIKGIVEEYAKDCDCRKPRTGMLKQALRDFAQIDPKQSYVVGDKACDVELGQNAGAKGILVRTGHGNEFNPDSCTPDYIAQDIADAIDWILADIKECKG